MGISFLDGKTLRRMLTGAAKNIRDNVDYINELNVFPVPDGDTGTNMTKTIEGGIAEISSLSDNDSITVAEVIGKFAHGALLGARGNSGVILSQIFAGIGEGLAECESATVADFASAYVNGVKKAYGSVMNPVEGTILTVFREAVEYASSNMSDDSSIEDFLSLHIKEAKESLLRTKEILPALKEADVVDSGGAGYVFIAAGMYSALTGEDTDDTYEFLESAPTSAVSIDAFTRDSVLEFGYCTEFLMRLQTSKVDPDAFDVAKIISYLESIGGESIVSYKTGDVVKVHVHTENPGFVLTKAREYGELLTVKIENMSLQHNDSDIKKPKHEHVPVAVVSVASGEGMSELFKTIGADKIISGGQTQNPSTEDFIKAFKEVDADDIIVLPNNKNIYLVAVQAAKLVSDKKVVVLETRSVPQGISAILSFDPDASEEDNTAAMQDAIGGVISMSVTHAVRDTTIEGRKIEDGQMLGMLDGKINCVANSSLECLEALIENAKDSAFITVFYGEDIDEETAAKAEEILQAKLPSAEEITVIPGGQPIYDFIISAEG